MKTNNKPACTTLAISSQPERHQKDFDNVTANTILKILYHQIKGEINRNVTVKTVLVRTSNRSELTFALNGVTIAVQIQEGGIV